MVNEFSQHSVLDTVTFRLLAEKRIPCPSGISGTAKISYLSIYLQQVGFLFKWKSFFFFFFLLQSGNHFCREIHVNLNWFVLPYCICKYVHKYFIFGDEGLSQNVGGSYLVA